jgi:capsular polysaccharide biosynthesis protein
VDDGDKTFIMPRVVMPRVAASGPPASSWADHELADIGTETGPAADTAAGLASLSFITAAIWRRRRFWSIAAALGLVLGACLFVTQPPSYKATTEAYLTLGPNEDPGTAINTDVALAQSRPVAALALHTLGLHESVDALLGSYLATPVTNRVIQISLTAPSSAEAARAANAVTAAFLQFRAEQLRVYQQLMISSLNQEIAAATAQAVPIANQANALSGNATSVADKTKLASLQGELATLTNQQQSARATQQTTLTATNTAVKGSYTINSASVTAHSRAKTGAIYALTGLIVGLALSIGFVVVAALVSDRLRVRDDIAHALGASVRLSVGPVRLRRLLPGRRGLAAVASPEIQRISGHLRGRLADSSGGAALAVVPADRDDVAALAVVALALSCAKSDKRVIVADLCPGAPAARLLGAAEPGVRHVNVQDTRLVAVIPERGDVVPTGPLRPDVARAQTLPVSADLAAVYSTADVLLTLAALDPMLGAEHLATWAADVVVMVTAGKSSWTRVQAVGEMVRLAGVRTVSAVLVGADKTDETLGVMHAPGVGRDAQMDENLSAGPLARSGS